MISDREREIERICQGALDRPRAERDDYLAQACGDDDDLRREVEQLLAYDGSASRFLGTPAIAVAAQGLGSSEPVLTKGQQFGAYTIVSRLGAGGMGEVYRARDSTLGREVAIKVLPALFTSEPDRLARFEREARILAALNHPNIATIHGVERARGIHAIVLEVVEGETLAEVIGGRPLPLEKALTIARQIADALEAAHDKGIVHRDLKPANIKVRPDGVVKVLDFGLAKLVGRSDGPPDSAPVLSHAPTLTVTEVHVGTVVGTAAYMSPEQARGQAVDKRADIWAFGCVLYEMLSGRSTFGGRTATDTIGDVLSREPDWTLIPATVPANVTRLLQRCLRKDPAKRLHDIADARLEIDDAHREPITSTGAATPPAFRVRERLLWAAALVGAIAATAAGAAWYLGGSQITPGEVRFEVSTPSTTDAISLAVSPDGRTLVFAATADGKSQLLLRALGAIAARPLPGTDNASLPFWSPDSRSIGFFADGQLKTIDVDSGSIRTLAPAAPEGGAWSERATILFSPGPGGGLNTISADGGTPARIIQSTMRTNVYRYPQFLPGGRRVLFHAMGTEPGIYVGEIGASGAPRKILDAQAAIYAAGYLLFVRQNTLFAQPFDPTQLALTGEPTAVAVGLIASAEGRGAALSASDLGVIALRMGPAGEQRRFVWFDRSGKELETVAGSNIGSFYSSLSPDGSSLAVTRNVGGKGADIWLLDVKRGVSTPFTFNEAFDLNPVWSPDGKRIAFTSNRNGTFDPYVKDTVGTRDEELLETDEQAGPPSDWSRDGRFILSTYQSAAEGGIWALPLEREQRPFKVVDTTFNETNGKFSPDGRWVAYQSNRSGQDEIYVHAFPGPGREWLISTKGGVQASWCGNSKEIVYLAPDNRLMAVPIELDSKGDRVDVGTAVPLFAPRVGGTPMDGFARSYSVSPDCQRFLVDTIPEVTQPVTVIMNWQPQPASGQQR